MGEVGTSAEQPPRTSTTSTVLLNPLRFPRLASPHGPDRAGGADNARERCRCAGARHSPGRSAPGSLWDTLPGRPLDLPSGGTGEGGGRSGGPAEDGRVEVGGVARRRAGAASLPGAGAAGAAGRAGARAVRRPATTRLDPTTPAVRRLEAVGGTAFTSRLQLQKELAVGAAVVTAGGGDLPAEFVIHAVIRSDTEPVTRDGVARAWRSTLEQAREWEFTSLTVPPIGTGAGNLSVEDAADIMVPILKSHLGNAAFPASVSIVVETHEEREAFEAALRRSGAAES